MAPGCVLRKVSFHRLQRGCAVGARGRTTLVSRLGQYDLVDTGRNFRVTGQPFEKRSGRFRVLFACGRLRSTMCASTCPWPVISWGPQGIEGRIVDAHPRRFADPQDDSILHMAAGCALRAGQLPSPPVQGPVPEQSFRHRYGPQLRRHETSDPTQ